MGIMVFVEVYEDEAKALKQSYVGYLRKKSKMPFPAQEPRQTFMNNKQIMG